MPPLTTRTFENSSPATSNPREPTPPPASNHADPRAVALADEDLRLQTWCTEHLDCLLPLLIETDPPTPPEIASGAILLLRTLFAEASSHDAAASRLWCPLSLRKLGLKLTKDKKTIETWWDACLRHELGLEGPDPQHSQRLRRRPRWDVIAPLMRAATAAGKIPPEPLFVETVETGGVTPPVSPELTGPVQSKHPKPGESLPRFDEESFFNNENFGGGVRGGSPLKGGTPLPPTPVTGNRGSDWTGPVKTGGVTPPVSELQSTSEVQLLLEFAEDADDRTQRKLDNLVDRQARTLNLVERIMQFLFASQRAGTKKSHKKKPPAETETANIPPRSGRQLITISPETRAAPLIDRLSDAELLDLARALDVARDVYGTELQPAHIRSRPPAELIVHLLRGTR